MAPTYSFDIPNHAGELTHVEVAADDEETATVAAFAAVSTPPAADPHLFHFKRLDGGTVTIGADPSLPREAARALMLEEHEDMISQENLRSID